MSDKRDTRFIDNIIRLLEIHGVSVGGLVCGNMSESYTERSHINASIESSDTTPIDITLMTGNGGNTEEGE